MNIQEAMRWLSWKITPEGTYLTVTPELVPPNWDINEIKKTLVKNKVNNFDISNIEKAIKNATGQMELIGPPFELFEEGKRRYLHLQVTPIQARFSMDAGILHTDYRITKDDIIFVLAEKAVVYGIDYDTIEEILSNEIYGQEFIIATATPPVAGKDAIVSEVIQIDTDAKPFLNEDGTVNYKKWDNIRQIKQGDIICVRIPSTPGLPGTSVFGHPLSPTPGEDYALPVGTNTKAVDGETKLVAAINGFLYRDGREICVGGVYVIKSDVDFKTGNIDYFGDVIIRGNVTGGFSVKAEGNISIEGYAEAANIESKNGNVFIKGSLFGQNKTMVVAKKNINAENAQDSTLRAGQTITVRKQIRNCKIETQNLEMPPEGQIISSSIFFSGYSKCGSIGGKTESLNEFTLIESDRQQLKDELQGINDLLQKLNKAIEALQSKLNVIKPSDASPEAINQKQILKSQLTTCESSKEQLQIKRKKLIRLIDIMPDKDALISAKLLFPPIKVSMYSFTKDFKQELSHLKIGWKSGGIKMESM